MEIMNYLLIIFKLIVFLESLLLILVTIIKNEESKIKNLSKGRYVK